MDTVNLNDLLPTDNNEEISVAVTKDFINRRCLIIDNDIDQWCLKEICMLIIKWNAEDKDLPVDKRVPIKIFVDSDGGDIILGDCVCSVIKTSITPVWTIGMGRCASMASYILASGKVRYAFSSTIVLIHDGTTGYQTSGRKGQDIQKFFDRLDDKNREFYLNNTNMTSEFLDEIADREYYMFADEAKEKGFIDKIIGIDCSIDEIL